MGYLRRNFPRGVSVNYPTQDSGFQIGNVIAPTRLHARRFIVVLLTHPTDIGSDLDRAILLFLTVGGMGANFINH